MNSIPGFLIEAEIDQYTGGLPKTMAVSISPAIAERLLQRNSGNRRLRDHKVREYADMMLRGVFVLTHQGICFDSNGALLDGQHRLAAIVKSNVTVLMSVTIGANPDTFSVLDSGLSRTITDRTKLSADMVRVCSALYVIANDRRKPPADIITRIASSSLGERTQQLLDIRLPRAPMFSRGAIIAGMVVAMDNTPSDIPYITEQYAAMHSGTPEVLLNAAMPIQKAVALKSSGRMSGFFAAKNDYKQLFCEALIVSDPANKHLKKVNGAVTEAMKELAVSKLRTTYGGILLAN